jgi:hypothetical protein
VCEKEDGVNDVFKSFDLSNRRMSFPFIERGKTAFHCRRSLIFKEIFILE